jgi:hypothetical protein
MKNICHQFKLQITERTRNKKKLKEQDEGQNPGKIQNK